MRLYIAGPMTGLPDFNYPAFNSAAARLEAAGYEVENPAGNKPAISVPEWVDYMRMAVLQIARVDGIALLDGWESSRGAKVEYTLAVGLGLPVRTPGEWLALA